MEHSTKPTEIQEMVEKACEAFSRTVMENREDAIKKALYFSIEMAEMSCCPECADRYKKQIESFLRRAS